MIKLEVQGNSMHPSLIHGERLFIDTKRVPVVGDIVFGKINGELTVHRLISDKLVKGDNSKFFDGEINRDFYIIGVAAKSYNSKLLAKLSKKNIQGRLLARPARLFMIIIAQFLRLLRS